MPWLVVVSSCSTSQVSSFCVSPASAIIIRLVERPIAHVPSLAPALTSPRLLHYLAGALGYRVHGRRRASSKPPESPSALSLSPADVFPADDERDWGKKCVGSCTRVAGEEESSPAAAVQCRWGWMGWTCCRGGRRFWPRGRGWTDWTGEISWQMHAIALTCHI